MRFSVHHFYKNYFFILLLYIFSIFTLFTLYSYSIDSFPNAFANTQEIPDKKRILRIGYQPERAFYSTLGETGQEGYGYEYMEKLLYYTKNKYTPEYVSVEWSEGFEMLKRGELDLLPFVFHTKEREQDFLFSKHPLITGRPLLLSLNEENQLISSDYREVQDAKICVYDHNIYHKEFVDFLSKHHIHANITIIPYTPIAQLKREGEYDYILSTTLLLGYELPYAIALDRKPVYLIANKENQALMDDMNYAFEALDKDDILFEKKLCIKYYQYFSKIKESLTPEELNTIQNQDYTVGVMNIHAPLSFITNKGEIAGIFVDTIKEIAKIGNFNVTFETLPEHPTYEEINAYDISILSQQKKLTEQFPRSNLFGSTPLILIRSKAQNLDAPYI